MGSWRRLLVCFALLPALLPVPAPAVIAAEGAAEVSQAERRLIGAYSPRLMIREQLNPPCDKTEEQYRPTAVETVLDNGAVKLNRLDRSGREVPVAEAPGVSGIAGLGEGYQLNLPGDPLGDTCVYAKDFRDLAAEGKAPAVTYAHVAREPGREGLAVQYWFFWYFNQFNDLHEGDWEGMQIVFESSDPRQALEEGPSEIALFQHAGGEKAGWEDGKVEKEGDHPVVYPAAGSHATFYESAVYVENGRKGSGVGCDNTTAPHTPVDVRPIPVPTDPAPRSPHAWLTYEGRWGQKEKGFNNGPTGPATKTQWREPITWMEGIRSTSPRLPVGSVLGPTVTKSFCGAVADVTDLLNRSQREPWLPWTLLGALLALLGFVVWRTRWRPVDTERLRAPRAFGQILGTAFGLYGRHWRVFAPIGIAAIPIVGGLTLLSWLIAGGDTGRRLDEETGLPGLHVALGEVVAGIGQPVASAVIAAVVIVAVRELSAEGDVSLGAAFGGMWRRFRRVVGAELLATVALIAMAVTVIGVPFAAWKYVSWLFIQQRILFEDSGVREAFRGSSALVRGRWWYTLRVAGVLWLIGIAAGPILGFALIFTNLPLFLINVIGTVVFALMVPLVAIGQTLLYFDLEALGEPQPGRLRRFLARARPAEA